MKVVSTRFIRERVVDRKKLGDRGVKGGKINYKGTIFEGADIHLLGEEIVKKSLKNYDIKKIREKSDIRFEKIDYNLLMGQEEEGKVSYYKTIYERTASSDFKEAKEDLKQHLNKLIKMAEDKQAIYEFIQNAEDSKARKMIFYVDDIKKDDKWFIFANNGYKFTPKDIYSILMISESSKHDSEEYIGKYGIGFKLIHRLVMKTSEDWEGLIERLYGPIIFSWGNRNEVNEFLKLNWANEGVSREDSWEYPVLFKFLITTFPAGFKEKISLHPEFGKKECFTEEDIKIIENIPLWFKEEIMQWDTGSLFIVPFRTENYNAVKSRLETLSGLLEFLTNLEEILWGENGKKKGEYKKTKDRSNIIHIPNSEFIVRISRKRNKFTDYPNIYNPLPIDDERYGFNFLINSRRFDVQAHRTKLANREEVKKALRKIKEYLEERKRMNVEQYHKVFHSIIISKPKMETDEKKEIWEYFKEELWDFLKNNIPVKDKEGKIQIVSYKNVFKKNNLELKNLYLEDFFPGNHWFPKDYEGGLLDNPDWLLFAERKEKIIESKGLNDIIRKNVTKFNEWIIRNSDQYLDIVKHVANLDIGVEWIEELKIVKYSETFYTIKEAKEREIIIVYNKEEYEYIKSMNINNLKLADYVEVLTVIFDKLHKHKRNFKFKIEIEKGKDANIVDIVNKYSNSLSTHKKVEILDNILNKFVGDENWWYSYKIRKEDLKLLKVFKNSNNELRPLSELLPYDLLPSGINLDEYGWLKKFVINKDEWEAMKSGLSSEELKKVKEVMLNEINEVYTHNEKYVDKDRIFYNGNLTEDRIRVIGKLIKTVVHEDVLKFIKKYPGNKILKLDSRLPSSLPESAFFPEENARLTLDDLKTFLEFIKDIKDQNFFNKWVFEPLIEDNSIKHYKLKNKVNNNIIVFYEGFSPETINKLKEYGVFIVNHSMPTGYGDEFGKIFKKIKQLNINYINGDLQIGFFEKEILKVYFENKYYSDFRLSIRINGEDISEWKPYEVRLDYPESIDWSKVFKDKTKEAGEISRGLSMKIFGNESRSKEIMERIFSEEILNDLERVYEILVEDKRFQKTTDTLLALLWLYHKYNDNKYKRNKIKALIVGNRGIAQIYALEDTKFSECTYLDYVIKKSEWGNGEKWDKVVEYVKKNSDEFYDFILAEPYKDKYKIYHTPVKNDDGCKKEFIEFVFRKWGSDAWKFKELKKLEGLEEVHSSKCSVCAEDYSKYIYPDYLALESEKIPQWLRVSDDTEEFEEFLEGFGILTPYNDGSGAIKLRKIVYDNRKGGGQNE